MWSTNPLGVAGTTALLLLVWFVLKLYKQRLLFRGLPGPAHHPILGHLIVMGKIARSLPPDANPQMYANLIRERYNLGDVFYLDLWPLSWPQMVIIDPSLAAEVAQVQNLPKGKFISQFLGPLVGKHAMVAVNGAEHKLVRGFFNAAYSTSNILRHVPEMVNKIEIFVDILKQHAAEKHIFPMEKVTSTLIFDIMGAILFDSDFDCQRTGYKLMADFHDLAELLPTFILARYLSDLNPFRQYRRWKLARSINDEIGRMLTARFEPKSGRQRSLEKPLHIVDIGYTTYFKRDFAEKGRDFAPELDKTFMDTFVTQCKTFLFAGHDTSSSSICYTYHILGKHPEVLSKLRQEHDQVFGTDVSDAPRLLREQPSLLQKLEYTMAVIKEALRIYPPIGGSYRFGDPNIPLTYNGTAYPTYPFAVYIVNHAMLRHPAIFKDPLRFYPERFMAPPSDPYFVPKDAWRVFEKGPRKCIGEAMAMVQVKVILVLTVRSFDIETVYERAGPVVDGERMYQTMHVTAKPKDSMPVRVTVR